MKAEKEFKIIQSALQQALAAGLFKDFETVNIVQNALAVIARELEVQSEVQQ